MDRTVDMAVLGDVHNCVRAVLVKKLRHQRAVIDIAAHEHVARIAGEAGKLGEIVCIRERIKVDHRRLYRAPVGRE